jgi:parvulin-like peptidyl-prolyl isomerase
VKYIIILIALILLISCNNQAVKQETKDNDPVIATWRGGQVTADELKNYIDSDISRDSLINFDNDSLQNELTNYILKKLSIGMLDSLQIDTVKSINDKYMTTLVYYAKEKLYDDSVRSKAVPKNIIRTLYKYKKYSYKISHILFADGKIHDITPDSLYFLLIKEPGSFELLAEKYSDDRPTASKKGELGWFSYDEIYDEFKDQISPDRSSQILNPVRTKFGTHIIRIDEIKRDRTLKPFGIEKSVLLNYIDKKYEKKILAAKYRFNEFLFRYYNIYIDTAAVDSSVSIYNSLVKNGADIDSYTKEKGAQILLSKLGNFQFTLKIAREHIKSYYPDVNYINRELLFKSIHSMYHRILISKAAADLGYTSSADIVFQSRIKMADEYIKYIIYQTYIPEIVKKFESKELNSFPSYEEIKIMWQRFVFKNFDVLIHYTN